MSRDNEPLYARMREAIQETERLMKELQARTLYVTANPTREQKVKALTVKEEKGR